ncbi:MAG: hypothetical protein J0G33_02605 [Afipia felis]|nr:hypothetical protein [Afipia felis]
MAFLSFLSSNWSLALVVLLVVAAVGAAAWFLKNWWLAAFAALILAGYYYGQQQWMAGFNDKANRDAKAAVAILTKRIDALNNAAAEDAKRAEQDAKEISDLREKANATPPNDAPCLDIDAARRVRGIK